MSPTPDAPDRDAAARHDAKKTDADAAGATASGKRERPLRVQLLLSLLVGIVVVSLVQAFVVRVHNVSSGSMQNTLGVTDRVLSSHLPYAAASPARGDIVIFAHGDTWSDPVRSPDPNPLKQAVRTFGNVTGIGISDYNHTVKRVIGVAGDTVACCDARGAVTVNGTALDEPYLFEDFPFQPGRLDCTTDPRSVRCFGPLTVPAGSLLVLGDHRSNSADSVIGCRGPAADLKTCARYVTVAQVTGKVIARAWPPGPIK